MPVSSLAFSPPELDEPVRADRPQDRAYARGIGLVLVAGGALLGAAYFALPGVLAGASLGALGAFVLYRLSDRRSARRRALLVTPFPEKWREYLLDHCDHYDRLPKGLRRPFEDDLRIFLLETRITGVETEVTDELRLLVAASAVTLSVGWPHYEWQQLTEVLLYPQEFDRDWSFEGDELAGQAHPWGTVILSVPSLLESFDDPDDGFHVGLHEFAHLLDVDQTHFDGIPVGLAGERAREWVQVAEKERERLRTGRSVLDPYGAEDPVEFLAVAVEAFFEAPLALRRRHAEMYAILKDYFAQDPAAWDDERGLVLD
jgi:Mlc titration factor MtfA (ptsG expression regulator)